MSLHEAHDNYGLGYVHEEPVPVSRFTMNFYAARNVRVPLKITVTISDSAVVLRTLYLSDTSQHLDTIYFTTLLVSQNFELVAPNLIAQ